MSHQAPHPEIAPLTRNSLKPPLYSQEPYFREAFHDLQDLMGDHTVDTVLRYGLVVVKPDGCALGATSTVVDFYARHGFELADIRPVTFNRSVWRSMWVYQMTQASLDRLLVNDLVIDGEAWALLFRSTTDGGLPATVRLSELKGPARMENQTEDCLRRAVGQPNRIFSLVHSADEPADFVRELGILFSQATRRAVATAMVSGTLSERGARLLGEIRHSDERPRRTFDREASRKQVVGAIAQRLSDGGVPTAPRELLTRAVDDLESGRVLRVPEFFAALLDAEVRVDSWDLAVAVSETMEDDIPGASKVIDNFGAIAWERP
ncbi:nucleoside-diphosphate kinase [Streptomyces cyaneus]|uniref:nucleoside-diphosphate kinase n=1 Tax=Streptomyces cyaneus TaxID=1904 RepID=UPI000FF89341|nr:nucleoside-diphosphate kinase [Streptomyces cyaneus]